MTEQERKQAIRRECWDCEYKEEVPGNAHIQCRKPDSEMTGDPHGIRMGWFFYPLLFDPIWKTKSCSNFKVKSNAVSGAISGAVSDENGSIRPM